MKKKNKKDKLLLSVFILVAVFVLMLLVRLFSGEDNWICQNGQWVRHGNPSAPAPTTECK